MKIIRIHDGMRAANDDGIGFQFSDLTGHFFISGCRLFDLRFFAFADRRNDQRRMRNHKTCQYGHRMISFLLCKEL